MRLAGYLRLAGQRYGARPDIAEDAGIPAQRNDSIGPDRACYIGRAGHLKPVDSVHGVVLHGAYAQLGFLDPAGIAHIIHRPVTYHERPRPARPERFGVGQHAGSPAGLVAELIVDGFYA